MYILKFFENNTTTILTDVNPISNLKSDVCYNCGHYL